MEETNKLDIKVELSEKLLATQLKKIFPEWAMTKCCYTAKNANLCFGKEAQGERDRLEQMVYGVKNDKMLQMREGSADVCILH